MDDDPNTNEPVLPTAQCGSKPRDQRSRSKDVPELFKFDFQGAQHTVKLLISSASGTVVIMVDGVIRRFHVTFKAGFDYTTGLQEKDVVEFAKGFIDPNYGVLTGAEIQEICRQSDDSGLTEK